MNKKYLVLLLVFIFILCVLASFLGIYAYYKLNWNTDNTQEDNLGTGGNNGNTENNGNNTNNGNTGNDGNTGNNNNSGNNGNNGTGETLVKSKKYALVISGESNDAQHYTWFKDSSQQAYKLLIKNGYKPEDVYYLFEGANEPDVDYESTLKNLETAVLEINKKSTEKDDLVFIFIGHGGFNGQNSSYALADTNIKDDKLAAMFSILKRNKLTIVFSPCNTGGFVNDLSGPNTVFISSTRPEESNRAAFIEPFLSSFDGSGDVNKDGKVSFAEAFNFASKSVKDQYASNHWGTLTEHAQLDDNGDGVSHETPIPNGQDGALAEETFL